ncbi:serpin family protein [soil metagenome]
MEQNLHKSEVVITQDPVVQPAKKVNKIGIIILVLSIFFIISISYILWKTYQNNTITQAPIPTVANAPSPQVTLILEPAVGDISTRHTMFAFDLLKKLAVENKENIFISPLSISQALSMVYNGADGLTKQEMSKVLQLDNMDINEINRTNKQIIADLNSTDEDVAINIANSIWLNKSFKPDQPFIDTNTNYYDAQVNTLDFTQSDAASTINTWVKNETKGKIPDIVAAPIPSDVVMYLINAIYFKGMWTTSFDEKLTQDRDFTSINGQTHKVPMMEQSQEDFSYLETKDFQAVELPYGKQKRFGMYIFLPKGELSSLYEKWDSNTWTNILVQFAKQEGTLILPKFALAYEKELKDILIQLGMGIAFSPDADFSKIEKDLQISKVKHKAFIEVNEKGAEAAAATSVEMSTKMGTLVLDKKKPFYMEINKPFLLAIYDNQLKELLFIGSISELK